MSLTNWKMLNIGPTLDNIVFNLYNIGPFAKYNMADIGRFTDNLNEEVPVAVKVASFIISISLAALLIKLVAQKNALGKPAKIEEVKSQATLSPVKEGPYLARWQEILRHMNSVKDSEWKFAIIEADNLLDQVLTKAGFPGESLGEKLMNLKAGELQNLQGLWDAHKTRNIIAHETNYSLRYAQARQTIESFQKALKELRAI